MRPVPGAVATGSQLTERASLTGPLTRSLPLPVLTSPCDGSALLSIIPNRFNRTSFQCFQAGGAFNFVVRLFADVGIGLLERAREVRGRGVAADVAIDAGPVNVEGPGSVFRHAGVSVSRHRVRSLTQSANT